MKFVYSIHVTLRLYNDVSLTSYHLQGTTRNSHLRHLRILKRPVYVKITR